jgi:hypothetical protein
MKKLAFLLLMVLLLSCLLITGTGAGSPDQYSLTHEEIHILLTMGFSQEGIYQLDYPEAAAALELYDQTGGKARLISHDQGDFYPASSPGVTVRMFYGDHWVSGSLRYFQICSQASIGRKPKTAAIGTVWEHGWNIQSVQARYSYFNLFGNYQSRNMSTLLNQVSYLGVAHSHNSWPSYISAAVISQEIILYMPVNFSQPTWFFARAVDSVDSGVSFSASFSTAPLGVTFSPFWQIYAQGTASNYYIPN